MHISQTGTITVFPQIKSTLCGVYLNLLAFLEHVKRASVFTAPHTL